MLMVLGGMIFVLITIIFVILFMKENPSAPALESTETPTTTPYLQEEEIIIIKTTSTSTDDEGTVLPIEKLLFEYVEVIDGCGIHFEGECLRVRGGPGTDYPIVARLRNDMVLKVGGKVEREDRTWYKIVFDEHLQYPERLTSDWYVASEYVNILFDEGEKTTWTDGNSTTTKRIIVDRSDQKLTAYEGEEIFMEIPISTGLELTPTPRGTFTVFKKTPSRYMQGPIPGLADQQIYDLPGVPWNLYFTHGGAVIHGAYWHNSFGSPYSHGCVNLLPENARKLYEWAVLGTQVIVRD